MKLIHNDMLRGLLIATLVMLLSQTVITITIAEEEDEDDEDDENTMIRNRNGDNERERLREEERERERNENEEREDENKFGGFTDIVLYITIGAVVGTIGYVLWKIIKIKNAKVKQQ